MARSSRRKRSHDPIHRSIGRAPQAVIARRAVCASHARRLRALLQRLASGSPAPAWRAGAAGASSRGKCLKPCERNLTKMRQVIAAQGKEADRLQSVLVVTDGKALDWLRYAILDYPGMRVVTGPPDSVTLLARQFTLPAGGPL